MFESGATISPKEEKRLQDEGGVIYLPPFITDDTSRRDWVSHLERGGFFAEKFAKDVLCSPNLKPTNGMATQVVILKGTLFENEDRNTENIRAYAEAFSTSDNRSLLVPSAELAYYLALLGFTDEDFEKMGLLRIVVMHEPIRDSQEISRLLYMGSRSLHAHNVVPHDSWTWKSVVGFAFVVANSDSQS